VFAAVVSTANLAEVFGFLPRGEGQRHAGRLRPWSSEMASVFKAAAGFQEFTPPMDVPPRRPSKSPVGAGTKRDLSSQ
jgi:hypothetical protein